ncbi:hypothetical protein GCM10027565_20490 [Bordetella tumulicola]
MAKPIDVLPPGAAERLHDNASRIMGESTDARLHVAAASAFSIAVLKELLPVLKAQSERIALLEDHITRPEK